MSEASGERPSKVSKRTESKGGKEKPTDQIQATLFKDQFGNMNLTLTADKPEIVEALRGVLGDTYNGYPQRLPTLYLQEISRGVDPGLQVIFQLRRSPELTRNQFEGSAAVPIWRGKGPPPKPK